MLRHPKAYDSSVRYAPQPSFSAGGQTMTATMDALLIGHEDWVFSAAWQPAQDAAPAMPCLLSASMDRTMMIWRPEASSGAPAFACQSCQLRYARCSAGSLKAREEHSAGSNATIPSLIVAKDQSQNHLRNFRRMVSVHRSAPWRFLQIILCLGLQLLMHTRIAAQGCG